MATGLPVVGARASAARQVGSVANSLASAATPLSQLLPRFDKDAIAASGGRIDVAAVAALGPVLTTLATSASTATHDLADIDPAGLSAAQADEIARLRTALADAEKPLRAAAAAVPLVAHLLGSTGPRTWFVALENLAEARGTDGLVGAYAVLRTDAGKVTLVEASPRKILDAGPVIPDQNLPTDFQQLWGADATEWAGLNLSPHFPYTAQLVLDGWKARGGAPLDGVIALDQTVVAALLAGTGPITVRGVTVDSASAVKFLTEDIYARFPVVADKDAVVVELVQSVFQKLSAGQVSLGPLVKALRRPISEGHFLVWSAHPDEQALLATYAVGGVLPDAAGPFAMAVVNNGGGNKLDAYTAVSVDYTRGACSADGPTSTLRVTVTDKAPASGLPAYVTGRLDLTDAEQASAPKGSTLVLLYLYGPVDSSISATTVDRHAVDVSEGLERGHPVWRVDLPLDPGQTSTVEVRMLEPFDTAATPAPTVGIQPMSIPQTVAVHAGPTCTA